MNSISTLHALRQHLDITPTADDDRLWAALLAATAHMERLTQRWFLPRVATLPHSVTPNAPHSIMLTRDLLTLQAVTSNSGTAYTPDDFDILDGGSLLRLKGMRFFTWQSSRVDALQVSGVWVYHTAPASAWRETRSTVFTASISADDDTIPVQSANAPDGDNQTPRFQVGQLLRIGAEYVTVLAVEATEPATEDAEPDTLRVLRGVNGTQAAAHSAGTPISRFQPPPDVMRLATRWAAWLYREPDYVGLGDAPLPWNRRLWPCAA